MTPMNRVRPSSRARARASTAPTRAVGDLPFVLLDEVVQLDQIDVVDPHPLERALEGRPGPCRPPGRRSWWRGTPRAVVGEPRLQAILGLAVRRRGVDVVDACRLDLGEDAVGGALTDPAEPGGAEDDPGRVVPGPPERAVGSMRRDATADRFSWSWDHSVILRSRQNRNSDVQAEAAMASRRGWSRWSQGGAVVDVLGPQAGLDAEEVGPLGGGPAGR